jgi:hypothetical protein
MFHEADKLYPSCIRMIDLSSSSSSSTIRNNHSVLGYECPGLLGIGGKLWDSTYVLLQYLGANSDIVRGKRVVELGSGTGMAGTFQERMYMLCGIYFCRTGLGMSLYAPAAVTITDLSEVVPLLQANLALNAATATDLSVRKILRENYRVLSHCWGDPVSRLLEVVGGCDVIIASDVVYDPIGYEPLIASIIGILTQSPPEALCILAHRHRHPEDAR